MDLRYSWNPRKLSNLHRLNPKVFGIRQNFSPNLQEDGVIVRTGLANSCQNFIPNFGVQLPIIEFTPITKHLLLLGIDLYYFIEYQTIRTDSVYA